MVRGDYDPDNRAVKQEYKTDMLSQRESLIVYTNKIPLEFRHTKEELKKFIEDLNFKIQYLGLKKDEVIKIIDDLYRD